MSIVTRGLGIGVTVNTHGLGMYTERVGDLAVSVISIIAISQGSPTIEAQSGDDTVAINAMLDGDITIESQS